MGSSPPPYANNDSYIPGLGLSVEETRLIAEDEAASRHHRSHRKRASQSASRSPHRSRPVGRGEDGQQDDEQQEGDNDRSSSWDNMRDGSISRRPAWQRPSPRWVVPFILGATVSMGMTLAPRAELYTDLACLVHPPRMPDSAVAIEVQAAANISTPAVPFIPGVGPLPVDPVSPGDKWFTDAQRDIYKYLHPELPDETEPIPLPSDPSPGQKNPKTPKEPGVPSPFPEIDPALCKSDAGVQRLAARVTMLIIMTGGVVSAMTTGFWASKSDRIGRRKVLSILELGFFINDACFLFITTYPIVVARFGIYLVMVGPFLEGLLGGLATLMAAMHAYISDVTPDGSRATHFGRLFAALMAGLAIGPVLGSRLITVTGNILSPFYITIVVHLVFAFLLRFALPESLSSESRAHLKKKVYDARDAARERAAAEREWEHAGDGDEPVAGNSGFSRLSTPMRKYRTSRRAVGWTRRTFRSTFSFLEPLEIFIPRRDENGRLDYNLFLIACLQGTASVMMGVQQMKSLYTQKAFGWKPAQLGPFMTLMGSLRLAVLVGLTPLVMYLIKPYFTEPAVVEPQSSDPDASPWSTTRSASPRAPLTETSPLLEPGEEGARRSASPSPSSSPSPAPPKAKRSAVLDLYVIRCCIIIEGSCWIALGLNIHHSPIIFLVGSCIMTLAAPAPPASNSLMLAMAPNKREVGRLFGAMGVLHALGNAIFAPLVFGGLYSATVDTYPPAIFLLSAGMMLVMQVISWFIRVPKNEEEARGRGAARARGRAERV